MALDNFIPEIWSARLLKHLDGKLVFKQLVNTEYEGEIRNFGDTVRVNRIGDITVGTYTKGADIGDPEELTSDQLLLTIDQFKYFNFYVDDVDSAQQNPKIMDDAMKRAAFALSNEVDKYIADCQIPIGDLTRISSWGISDRFGDACLVLLDNGLNDEVLNKYYR